MGGRGAVLGGIGLYWGDWAALCCTGGHWAAMGCPELYWGALSCAVLTRTDSEWHWAVLGGTGLACADPCRPGRGWAALHCTGLVWAVLGGTHCTGRHWADLGWRGGGVSGLYWRALGCPERGGWAVLGCTGLACANPCWPGGAWAVLGCTGLACADPCWPGGGLGCTGQHWAALGYTGGQWAVLGCPVLTHTGPGWHWAVLGGTRLPLADLCRPGGGGGGMGGGAGPMSESSEDEEGPEERLEQLMAQAGRELPCWELEQHFAILGELGRGSYGRVVLAQPRDGGPSVVLKLVPKERTGRGAFLRELCLTRCLSHHPCCLRALPPAFETPTHFAFGQERAPAGDLCGLLSPGGPPVPLGAEILMMGTPTSPPGWGAPAPLGVETPTSPPG
ncbi:uncharacterized protein LOC121089388 [Falco naumanni]|uniref:uncharacterized protein LOC121089388 n=1 Tax=Falco naumanni TaxID=148594 RepID=UPI001ADDE89D|nr:uncharacterized protein LOC121089388 [Falco naumanni]